jgi:hypothetical protein
MEFLRVWGESVLFRDGLCVILMWFGACDAQLRTIANPYAYLQTCMHLRGALARATRYYIDIIGGFVGQKCSFMLYCRLLKVLIASRKPSSITSKCRCVRSAHTASRPLLHRTQLPNVPQTTTPYQQITPLRVQRATTDDCEPIRVSGSVSASARCFGACDAQLH